jgi:glycerate dehydrogenase
MMKIVFLDALSVGNVDFKNIEKEGELIKYNLTSKEEVFERIADAEIIITNKVYIGKEEIEAAPKLKLICVSATGYNNIDIKSAREAGVVVVNAAGYSTESVAQHVFAMILEIYTSLSKYDRAVKEGKWSKSPLFTMNDYPSFELSGKTLGIIGYGEIGNRVQKIAEAFGIKVIIAESRSGKSENSFRVPFDTVLNESDIITIHTPLTESTRDMISYREFGLMKKTGVIINTARGGIINENALYTALKDGKIYGAATDVMVSEPPVNGSPLFELENIVITPHTAWAATESRQKLIEIISENIVKFKSGDMSIDLCKR